MAKRQALLHGAACILWGTLILPVSAADNLHFSGSLVASPCTLTMQGADIAEVDFSSLDASDFIPGGQSARKPLVFELTDCDSALSNGVQVIFTGTEATGMRGILAIDSYSGASGIGIGIETLSGVPVGINNESGAVFTLVTGKNTLSLNAWVQRLPGEDLIPGRFSASALATFEYL
ncbi:fimbrial protein [Salmonella enterica subsp. enterica serovar Herston]|uniref:Fimbrial protein n=1 Tax=Salmonella enterica TaxID=28901 RepID=A0A744J761_SALER|nr:fimbrial protein [Salmonella enterica]EAW1632172.1 fimbrial protein [Salmonella enterica subsp. enterica]EBY7391670.1 fimbrial protein [Salmonella enterica subsp. enterica serovar Herston]ECT8842516.1 fimbrial protein [Salmonella enterica subsp. enterica serovar Muenchen]ECU9009810.1 fimbrial protein [Salmonella enterica subsp. enterica serovar Daytona]EAN1243910.1 fimbrial protein [Salmonella enterica]